jgi:hypothetical protein
MRGFNGLVSGKWREPDLAALRRSAIRTRWPWDTRKIRRLAERLDMTDERVRNKLRLMQLGYLMKCSVCNYCDEMVKHFDTGFCRRGAMMNWRRCGVIPPRPTATCPQCGRPSYLTADTGLCCECQDHPASLKPQRPKECKACEFFNVHSEAYACEFCEANAQQDRTANKEVSIER